jgi:lipopolysaccharide/colanic/teichoic acid biosynthesis glycosyltransferase
VPETGWTVSRFSLPLPASSPTCRPALDRPEDFGFTIGMAAKRLVDLTGALVGLVFLAPLFLAIAAMIRRDSPGPVLFRQRRFGRHGKTFLIWKFRTMYADAEARVAELEARNQAAGGVLFKINDDPRVTEFGKLLRRTNLDELPQLLNVLKGEMSLVGPRPFQGRDSERLKQLDPTAFARRLEFPPGLTGAWQVGRKNPLDSEHLLDFDLDYVENWSLGRDLKLILQTVALMLGGLRKR